MRKSAIASVGGITALIITVGTVWLSIARTRGGIDVKPGAVSSSNAIAQQRIQPSQRVLRFDAIQRRCLPMTCDRNRCTFDERACTMTGYYAVEPGRVTFVQAEQEVRRRSFEVYTATEINALLDQTINAITASGGPIDQKIGAAETRMNTQITNTVSNLSQNLLTEEARRQIREQVTADMRGDLDQFRSAVQALRDDVEDLKRQRQRRR